jgi:hypothetical protein
MNVLQFRDTVINLIKRYNKSDTEIKKPVSLPLSDKTSPCIFICYSHENKNWLNYLKEKLDPYAFSEKSTYWVDTEIIEGENWEEAINQAIDHSDIAILLVSNTFLSSKFIRNVELPQIFSRYEKSEIDIFWFCVEECPFHLINELKRIQAAHDPNKPLNLYTKAKRDSALTKIVKKIGKSYTLVKTREPFF